MDAASARERLARGASIELAPGIVALAEGGLWLPERRVLAVADLHVGYEAWHAAHGTTVPRVETRHLSRTLRTLVERLRPDRVVVDGDVVHARTPRTTLSERRALASVLSGAGTADLVLVAGNHDRALADLHEEAPVVTHVEGEVLFAHGHATVERPPGAWLVVGHEHPVARLTPVTGPALRLPCFLVDAGRRTIVLPALSPWAAGVVPRSRFHGAALAGADPRASRVLVQGEGSLWDFGALWDGGR